MAITRIAQASAVDTGTTVATTAAINTTGATLIVLVRASGAGSPPTPTDSALNVWTALTEYNNTSSAGKMRAYYVVNPTTNAAHTFSMSGAGGPAIAVIAYAGTHASAPFDVENGDTTTPTGSSIQPGSVTPGTANEVVVTCAAQQQQGDTLTIGGTFGVRTATAATAFAPGISLADEIQTTATARNPTWSVTNFQNVSANIATFKAAAAAGGSTRPPIVGGGYY